MSALSKSLHHIFFCCLEIFILILMAVDRYVAICKPLRYMTLMSHRICGVLVAVAWVGSCIHSSAQILLASSLPFCGPNVIDHWSLINFQPLLKLLVQTPMWPTYSWCPTVGPSVQWVLLCWCSPMLSSYILWETTVLRGRKKPSTPASPTSLWSSFSLVLAYLYTLALQPPSPWIRW